MIHCFRLSICSCICRSPAGTNIQVTSAEAAGRIESGPLGHWSIPKRSSQVPQYRLDRSNVQHPCSIPNQGFPNAFIGSKGGELTAPAFVGRTKPRSVPRSTQHPDGRGSDDEEEGAGQRHGHRRKRNAKIKQGKAQPADRIKKKPELLILLVVFRVGGRPPLPMSYNAKRKKQ